MFTDPDAQSAFLRASNIGFRCVKYIEPESIAKIVTDPMPSRRRELSKQKPASDELFRAYRSLYSYDKTALNSSVETLWQRRRRLESGEDHLRGSIRQRAGDRLPLPSQERPAAIPDGNLFSWFECISTPKFPDELD
jgi:hypothetical protein